jgi:hypothetical protein
MRPIVGRLTPVVLTLVAICLPAGASAASSKQIKTATQNGASFLKTLQEASGGFETDWVLGALAASGNAAADVKAPGVATDARSYYRALLGNPATWPGSEPTVSDYERAALNSYAAGIDPARVSVTQNLIARIVSYYDPAAPGYYGGTSNFTGTVFAALALAETKTRSGKQRLPQALLQKSIEALKANQHADGGWTFEKAAGEPERLAETSEPDETGAVMAALCSAGVPNSGSVISRAESYLQADLGPSGAFNAPFGANTDSNAWAVQGLNACGIDPQGPDFTSTSDQTPVDFLLSQQLPGGGFVYEAGEAEANEYSSQDAVRALSGAGFTAKPPSAKGAPHWLYESSFQPGTHSLLTLVINSPGAALKVCSVSIAPAAATSTLAAVLEAAKANSTPTGCVTSFAPSSGKGNVTQINGSPVPAEAKWDISIDGGTQTPAKLTSKIELGDTISLTLG